MKKVAILQSNYIPWKGYFDIIHSVDEFILYDDMQYTRRDWRNRNRIISKDGTIWLTIPVESKGKYYQKIKETKVSNHEWIETHKKCIQNNYARSPFFKEYKDVIFSTYDNCKTEDYLSKINYNFILTICSILGIETKISWSSDYLLIDGKTERLVQLVKDAGGDYYLSGPAAKDYIDAKQFEDANIELAWMDYSGYREYNQNSSKFIHEVSILDLIFNEGKRATDFIWGK